ncbi:hypothetical protein LEP1GSC103_2652 [Leptospira borgpetersenii serovar Javanica str. UI 09931]|uniref:Uncharacterized protein n=3 Tax=Leptospira borgpetersenii TaxID=174 RepID=A0A0S2ILL3_LEPBO|nr:hypothetical protein LBBP_00169 [Leptospira borgpetersenii serovar Ballum]EKQ92069.1 hypothetical protein LEP1GSC101_2998 [Leptospira borgpetersenii str. UI 09149]EKQ98862.1 hypothetical protein LEP1GSC121_0434 [Leptospira borgpetersenii serovar Castellonis str. 200801910]EMK09328.1 hypothetical protein LEP1GSC066_1582 [Leptospira sp. serovar Kenya str. Sh9]EMN13742.1 hypothetical protein LEP1GSC055_3831 [Leptospira borgpetersenii str. Brem 307]EMN17736.1 hypothetical protein LEP1GSC056_290
MLEHSRRSSYIRGFGTSSKLSQKFFKGMNLYKIQRQKL